jgi:acetate CoA/acetoacetate CoA-transferase beta subunit
MSLELDKAQLKELIARRVAKELKDGDLVNLGIGLPTLAPAYLSPGIEVTLHAENGIVGFGALSERAGPDGFYTVDAGGKPAGVEVGGACIDSATSFGLIRGGHINATVLGALQVDQEGNLANWIIPGKMVPGMGGAMDLVVGSKRVIVAMEHTQKGQPKILKRCTLPLTAVACVDMIITEMGVFEFLKEGLTLTELSPGYTLAELRAATEADFVVSDSLTA